MFTEFLDNSASTSEGEPRWISSSPQALTWAHHSPLPPSVPYTISTSNTYVCIPQAILPNPGQSHREQHLDQNLKINKSVCA